jgi:hypothetical protein
MIVYNKTTLGIFAIVATLGVLTVSTALTLQPAHALSKFFNCTTDVANKTHNLTLEDVNACYNKEFHTSGGPGTGITPATTTHITTTESGEYRGSLHNQDAIRTSIHSPSSSSEESHRASSHNEGFSSPTTTTTESGEYRGSLHHHHGTIITSIHSPSSSSEGSHRAHNEGFSSSSAAASIDELLRGYSGVHSSSSSASGDAAASSSSSSGGASASASATSR